MLLKKWAAEKRIQRDPIYRKLSFALEKALLAEIAYAGFKENRLFFPSQGIIDQIRTFLASNLNAPKHVNGEEVLKAIEVQQGILVERATGTYSFSHLTLQEYLTAEYLNEHRELAPFVDGYLADPRWREVFLLVSGLMYHRGADELLSHMEKAAQNMIRNPRPQALLMWAHQNTAGSAGPDKPSVKRTLALYYAFVLVLDGDPALVLDRALDLAGALAGNAAGGAATSPPASL